MKKLLAVAALCAFTSPAYALFGIGDLTYDPSTYGAVVKQYETMKQMYDTTKSSLDKLASIEKTITDAQAAAQTLGSFNLKNATSVLKQDTNGIKTAAQLRAALANTEGSASQNASYIEYQLHQLDQLDNLAKLREASASNADQATNKNNSAATSAAIAAQSTATMAALAAAQEQRRIQDETQRAATAKATMDNVKNSTTVYEAMGK